MDPQTMAMLPLMLMRDHGGGGANVADKLASLFIMCISILSMHLMTALAKYTRHKPAFLSNIRFLDFFTSKPSVYQVKAKLVYRNERLFNTDITKSFYAIEDFLYNKITADKQCKSPYYVDDVYVFSSKPVHIVCFHNTHTRYEIAPGIFLQQTMADKIMDKDNFSAITYTIELTAADNDYSRIKAFVNECIQCYDELSVESQQIFIFEAFDEETSRIEYSNIDFNTTKTFDNMFFEQKDDIMQRIQRFQEGGETYARLGIPYTLGFMFHGPPGTGKTSTIKSIAKLTKRHIIVIPVKRVKTAKCLKAIFLDKQINFNTIPNSKRLYVFEEVDCGAWRNIVKPRNAGDGAKSATVPEEDAPSAAATALTEVLRAIPEFAESGVVSTRCKKSAGVVGKSAATAAATEELSLGDLLELLDGVIEIPNRMLIMTSNHPEHLDPALLRPGRIDMVVEFKKMRRRDIADMYRLWFDEAIPADVYDVIPDYTYTQAEIGNMFSLGKPHALNTLMRLK
jgi:hypothetical protein